MNETAMVYIVDDEPKVLRAIGRLVRSAGYSAATFSSPKEFLSRHDPLVTGCLVVDIAMPEMNGLDLQAELAAKGSALPIIFLTGRGDISMSVKAIKRGAVDFLTKPVDDSRLIDTIQQAIKKCLAVQASRAEIDQLNRRLATLTARELQVLRLIVKGDTNKEIAAALGTVEKTIKVHRGRVMEKMGVDSLAQLVRLAIRAKI